MKKTLLKKLDIAVLLASMIIALAACGGGSKTVATSESESVAETTVVETEEESEEIVEPDGPTVDELLSTYNGPGDLAGSPFEAAIQTRNLGKITRAISTKDVVSVQTEARAEDGWQETVFEIRVVDENMTLRFRYFQYEEFLMGGIVEEQVMDIGKVNVTAGSFDVLEQKAEEIGNFMDHWAYNPNGTDEQLGHTMGVFSPFARVFDHSVSAETYVKLIQAYKALVKRLYDNSETPPTIHTIGDMVEIRTDYGSLTIDKHNRTVKNSGGQVIAIGASLESEPRKQFNAVVFDDDAQVQIVAEAIQDLYPEVEPLF